MKNNKTSELHNIGLLYPVGKVFYKAIPFNDKNGVYIEHRVEEIILEKISVRILSLYYKKEKYCKEVNYMDDKDRIILSSFNGDISREKNIFDNKEDAEKYAKEKTESFLIDNISHFEKSIIRQKEYVSKWKKALKKIEKNK